MSGRKQTGALRIRKTGGEQWQEENQPFEAAESAVDAREWYYWIAVWRVPADVARPLPSSILIPPDYRVLGTILIQWMANINPWDLVFRLQNAVKLLPALGRRFSSMMW